MADKDTKNHIVAYDISEPKRLIKVNKLLKTYGLSLQYSVFLVPLNRSLLERLMSDLSEIINHKEDDIRIYPLPTKAAIILLGKQQLPEGIFINQLNLEIKNSL